MTDERLQKAAEFLSDIFSANKEHEELRKELILYLVETRADNVSRKKLWEDLRDVKRQRGALADIVKIYCQVVCGKWSHEPKEREEICGDCDDYTALKASGRA